MRRVAQHGKGLAPTFDFRKAGFEFRGADAQLMGHLVISYKVRMAVDHRFRTASGFGLVVFSGRKSDIPGRGSRDDRFGEGMGGMGVDGGGPAKHILFSSFRSRG